MLLHVDKCRIIFMYRLCLEVTKKVSSSFRSLLILTIGGFSMKEGIFHKSVPIDVS